MLSIGDGANDVSMINEADVGVGIRGVEGGQAASASDFSITEFQQLRPLLMFHGRECNRRNSYMIQYNFYKNIVFTVPLALFGLISGWSGETIYDIYILQIFNVVFTVWPIIFFCLFDFEHGKEKLMYTPSLYSRALIDPYLSVKTIIGWFTQALAHGVIVWFLCQVFFGWSLSEDGMTTDMLLQGNMIYLAVVCVCNFQILFDSNLFNWITLLGVIYSIGSYFVCVLIESQFEVFGIYQQYLDMNTLQI